MNKFVYAAAGLAAFIGFIVVMAPASLALSAADQHIKAVRGLNVGNAEGRIWNGKVAAQYGLFAPVDVQWDLAATPLVLGQVAAAIDVSGNGLDVSFLLDAEGNTASLSDGRGEIQGHYINQVSGQFGMDLSGTFTLTDIAIDLENNWPTRISGEITWPGGLINIDTPQQLHSVSLPPMRGLLSTAADALVLTLYGETEEPLITLTLRRDGWAKAAVSFAFMALTEIPIPGQTSSGNGIALLLEEKVL